MTNLLNAIINIIENPVIHIKQSYLTKNKINNVGDSLENYIKDAFSGTLNIEDEKIRLEKFSETFSYLGNQNNPPDIILRNGDAIEVKKIQSHNSALALNSSYPKSKLYSDNPMLTKSCVVCEEWTEKDLIYCVGFTDDNSLKYIFFVYGIDYAAEKSTYEKIRETISKGISYIPDVEFTQTKELGKVKKVDPLGITDLRIRGMWHIQNPLKVFDYILNIDLSFDFQIIAIINQEKFDSFSENDRKKIMNLDKIGFEKSDVKVKNPNNPSQLVDAKLFLYRLKI